MDSGVSFCDNFNLVSVTDFGVSKLVMQLAHSDRVVTVVILAMVVTVLAVNVGLCLCFDGLGQWDFRFVLLGYAHALWV